MQKSEIARDILSYLAEHPAAQDTLEGIVEWWLLEQRIKTQVALVKETMADLVRRKLVLESQEKDSRIHYRINRSGMEELRQFLKKA